MKNLKFLFIGILQILVLQANSQKELSVSSDSLFNLGNNAFNQDQFDEAIFYYEKAKLLEPRSRDILINLQLANEKLSTDIIELDSFFLTSWWNTLANLMLPGGWKVLSIILLICSIIILYLFYFKGWPKKKIVFLYILGSVFVIFFVSVFAGKTRYDQIFNSPIGIVFGGDQILYVGPDMVSEEAKQVTGGNRLRILDEDGDWFKVSAMDKEQGWIKKENVKLIRF